MYNWFVTKGLASLLSQILDLIWVLWPLRQRRMLFRLISSNGQMGSDRSWSAMFPCRLFLLTLESTKTIYVIVASTCPVGVNFCCVRFDDESLSHRRQRMVWRDTLVWISCCYYSEIVIDFKSIIFLLWHGKMSSFSSLLLGKSSFMTMMS